MDQIVLDGSSYSKEIQPGKLHLLGFQFDGTACYRKGSALGPDSIREASSNIETYSPYLNRDTQDLPNYLDLGNLSFGDTDDIESKWGNANEDLYQKLEGHSLKDEQIRLLTLGGEHSISYAPIKKYLEAFPNLVLLHLDAHADLRDGYQGFHYSHASVIRRCLDHFNKDHSLYQYGIRSGTKEEFQWMKEHATCSESLDDFIQKVIGISEDRPIYLTLDFDYFDPGIFPGTGTPEAGGESFHSFIKLIKVLAKKNFVGADVTELAPELDSSGNSSVFAAKVVRELVLILGQ